MRLLNASVGYPGAMSVSVNNGSAFGNVAYGAASSYQSVNVGATNSQIVSNGVTILNRTPTLVANSNYAMIVYGKSGNPNISLLQENQTAPATGYASFLVLNLAQDAGPVDVYLSPAVTTPSGLGGATPVSGLSPTASNIGVTYGSGYNSVSTGSSSTSYEVRITGYNNKTDLRLDIPSVSLSSGQVYTLILTGSPSGVLVNGMLVQQQSTVTPYTSTSIRARLIMALNATMEAFNATLTAGTTTPTTTYLLGSSTSNGTTTSNVAISPTVGDYYTILDGTNAKASISVQSASSAGTNLATLTTAGLPATANNLPATPVPGTDYTLLVWGSPSNPQLTVLTDDNTYPIATGYANMRVVNGANGFPGGVTLSANYTQVVGNVLSGTQSANFAVPYDTTPGAFLQVSTASSSQPIAIFGGSNSNPAVPLNAGANYIVYVLGDGSWTNNGSVVTAPCTTCTPNFTIVPVQLR
ncbi:MAG: DUF4397 domain-containing protein [Burkholderiaceae bacterium]|nr:DUF4397 domain-containing protein [Roseateles sp.]MBV8469679.1 DUF4397 domain-containing protein [Burkholderiaceae bacterium]